MLDRLIYSVYEASISLFDQLFGSCRRYGRKCSATTTQREWFMDMHLVKRGSPLFGSLDIVHKVEDQNFVRFISWPDRLARIRKVGR